MDRAATNDLAARAEARHLDAHDPLAFARERFELAPDVIYLDGNSLGALPKTAIDRISNAVRIEWGRGLIGSWNDAGWFDLPRRVGDAIGAMLGAGPNECLACDSTSVNLYKALSAAIKLNADSKRDTIVGHVDEFPTDAYVAQGLVQQLGGRVRLSTIDLDRADAFDARTAVVMLTHVDYKSGALREMRGVTERVHAAGALVVWDLAHSAGAVPIDLHAADADFAVGCGYKYLNGGPGAPAFIWVHPRHHRRFETPISGWFGHAAPFDFSPQYAPAEGVARAGAGTPPILSIIALECGVQSIADLGIETLREKSIALSELFIATARKHCGDSIELASPVDPAHRGSHVAWRAKGAAAGHEYAIVQALIARGVIGDFRSEGGASGLIRFGFAPAYVRFVDAYDAAIQLADVIATESYLRSEFRRRATVT